MNLRHLKKVPSIDNKAPAVHSKDKRWSDVFEKAAQKLDTKEAAWLCEAIERSASQRQAGRMSAYITELIDPWVFVRGWLRDQNGNAKTDAIDLYAYRAAWARHLAAQFRAKGL